MAGEGRLVESLGEDVGDVVVGVSLDELDRSFEHLIADEVVLGLDVLGAFVVDRVLGELDAALISSKIVSGFSPSYSFWVSLLCVSMEVSV